MTRGSRSGQTKAGRAAARHICDADAARQSARSASGRFIWQEVGCVGDVGSDARLGLPAVAGVLLVVLAPSLLAFEPSTQLGDGTAAACAWWSACAHLDFAVSGSCTFMPSSAVGDLDRVGGLGLLDRLGEHVRDAGVGAPWCSSRRCTSCCSPSAMSAPTNLLVVDVPVADRASPCPRRPRPSRSARPWPPRSRCRSCAFRPASLAALISSARSLPQLPVITVSAPAALILAT